MTTKSKEKYITKLIQLLNLFYARYNISKHQLVKISMLDTEHMKRGEPKIIVIRELSSESRRQISSGAMADYRAIIQTIINILAGKHTRDDFKLMNEIYNLYKEVI